MNGASGAISFPQDKLEVAALSKSDSIFSLWVQEPLFLNSAGSINFEGIVLNPGFIGASGKIITITFRTKAAGPAPVTFSSGLVLANDGNGTNILTGMDNANFSIGKGGSISPEILTPVDSMDAPAAPAIHSSNHSDGTKWYTLKDAEFMWELPSGIIGTRLLMAKTLNAIPAITYGQAINSKEIKDIDDGIWYFFVQLRNNIGWGAVSRFRLQIDSEKPSRFSIVEAPRTDAAESNTKFIFDADDKTSGIDHYEVQIDNGNSYVWKDDESHQFEIPVVSSGRHTLIAKAVDKAGNWLTESVGFEIAALGPPIITEFSKQLTSGEHLMVKGTSNYPNIETVVWFQREGEELKSQTVRNDAKGNFTFIAEEKVRDGIYNVWAETVDDRGVRSAASEKIIISVELPPFLKLGSWTVSLPVMVMALIVFIASLVFAAWYGWRTFTRLRGRLRKEVREAEHALHKIFNLLQEDIQDHVKLLEKARNKRELTHEEEKILKQLKKDLNDAEKFMIREIEDIEKEII